MRRHHLVPPRATDPDASKFDWENDVAPAADLPVPAGQMLVRMANAVATSAGNAVPDQLIALPFPEAAVFVRQGLAHQVRQVPGAALPRSRYVNPREVYEATR